MPTHKGDYSVICEKQNSTNNTNRNIILKYIENETFIGFPFLDELHILSALLLMFSTTYYQVQKL